MPQARAVSSPTSPENRPVAPTWVDYALGREERPVDLHRVRPPSQQSGLSADYFAYIPRSAGGVPLAPKIAQLARVLKVRAQRRREIQRGASPGIETDTAPAQPEAPVRVAGPIQATMRQTLSNYRATFTGETVILPSSRQRAYILIINVGANDVWLAFDKIADSADGVPLRTPDGFLELTHGTASEIRAFVAAGNTGTLIVTEGLHYPALERR